MKNVPNATLQRYPVYLKALRKIASSGKQRIMSRELSDYVNIKPTTIRRDFSLIGSLGKQGYGYDVEYLIDIFSNELGMYFDEKIILVGAGNLGRAILNYNHWDNVVGEIVCAFDKDPERVGKLSVPVYDVRDIKKHLPKGCRIAIVCVSTDVQNTIDLLVDAGIIGIVDFTHEHFTTPKNIHVRSVDVVSSIQELVFETNSMAK
ncbi:MAG: redox-sensing transcriptional repressor Rex [Erysipelotrichaceae bacterium]|jgi:redox-sensing transcriptional repressor|nr:redox-sensing transcriptional repressor Rex [Erysipelotrichaceae bacterium]MBR3167354.1 redox-sensing transcriptional repressor Rex [Erysipelotrichaceae bacterium]MCR5300467.1 redox-sensing transcriptional repressor Rex [Erysipelotrichaceae bacterium]